MKVKRFIAESMQSALRQVRDQLGAEAVILSNKRVEGGIEIVAALNYSEEAAKAQLRETALVAEREQSPAQLARMHAQRELLLQEQLEAARQRVQESVRKESTSHSSAVATSAAPIPNLIGSADDRIVVAKTAARRPAVTSGRSVNGIESLLNPKAKASLQAHAKKIEQDEAITVKEPPVQRFRAQLEAARKKVEAKANPVPALEQGGTAEKSVKSGSESFVSKPALVSANEPSPRETAKAKTALAWDEAGLAAARAKVGTETQRMTTSDPVSTEAPKAVHSANPRSESRNQWDSLADMRDEIQSIKRMIQHSGSQSTPTKPRVVADLRSRCSQRLGEQLSAMGLTGQVREALLRAVGTEDDYARAWQLAREKLTRLIRVEAGEVIDKSGVVALLGPTGSGKTMSIGKMAARYVMKYGADGIALVTTDRYRIAAHEQLKVFGRILNVPVFTVSEKNSLDDILDKLSHKKLVLVDTAGLLHTDPGWADQMQELKLSRHTIKPYLVLAATGQYQLMCSQFHVYRRVGLAGVMLTKLDEAVSLGELLSFLAASRMPAAYMTDGQRVPADLHKIDVGQLIDRAQDLSKNSERWLRMPAELELEDTEVEARTA